MLYVMIKCCISRDGCISLKASGLDLEIFRDALRSDGHRCRKCEQHELVKLRVYIHSLSQRYYTASSLTSESRMLSYQSTAGFFKKS